VLAEDAVKAALADYRKKNGLPVEDHDHAGDHAGGKAGA
jgi:hypothetical protein